MATTEDFTFPIFTDTFSCSIDSPPLWCLSPAASDPDSYHEETSKFETTDGEKEDDDDDDDEEEEEEEESTDQEEDYRDCFPTEPLKYYAQRKSLSSLEEGSPANLVKRNGSQNYDKEEKMDMLWEDFNADETLKRSRSSRLESETVNMGCVEALRLSKTNNGRKPSFVVFVKVLKKLFVLHNSHRSVKPHRTHKPSVKGQNRSHTPGKTGT